MQDRFKFRVWHVPTKTMYEVYEFNKDFVKATPDLVVISVRTLKTKDCILIQCAGLKDKNGKLIYEGDIMQVEFKNETLIAVVEHDKEDTGFGCKFNPKSDTLYSLSPMKSRGLIIGNIYENPELLKDGEE